VSALADLLRIEVSCFDPLLRSDMELKELGERIREMRKRRGITQEALAADAGISAVSYGRIERGERSARFDDLMKIFGVLGMSLSQGITEPIDTKKELTISEHLNQITRHVEEIKKMVR